MVAQCSTKTFKVKEAFTQEGAHVLADDWRGQSHVALPTFYSQTIGNVGLMLLCISNKHNKNFDIQKLKMLLT